MANLVKAADRPIYRVQLRPEPGTDAIRALRRMLKYALRSCGLKCLKVTKG